MRGAEREAGDGQAHQLDLAQHDKGGACNAGEEDEEAAVEDGRQVSHLGDLQTERGRELAAAAREAAAFRERAGKQLSSLSSRSQVANERGSPA